MKSNAITRIIIYSILIFILLSILLTGLGIGMLVVNFGGDFSEYTTMEDSEIASVPPDFSKISVEWAAGSIDVQTADIQYVTFSESGAVSEAQQMVWKVSGDTLHIYYNEPGFQIGFLSNPNKKNLSITVPMSWSCDELALSVASSDISVKDFSANNVDIETASGDCDFLNCQISDLDIDTASGSIQYSGTLNTLDCNAASASFTGVFENTPDGIDMDSASGDLNITLPLGSGFNVDMDSLSGRIQSDFEGHYEKDTFISGDGHCDINFDAASGSIKIHEG